VKTASRDRPGIVNDEAVWGQGRTSFLRADHDNLNAAMHEVGQHLPAGGAMDARATVRIHWTRKWFCQRLVASLLRGARTRFVTIAKQARAISAPQLWARTWPRPSSRHAP
jgi:hypothetical protein